MLKIGKLKAGNSTRIYLDQTNMLLDTYAPPKRINKYKIKFNSKRWMTLSLQQSISVKDKLFKNFINKKDPILNFTLTTKNIETYPPSLRRNVN